MPPPASFSTSNSSRRLPLSSTRRGCAPSSPANSKLNGSASPLTVNSPRHRPSAGATVPASACAAHSASSRASPWRRMERYACLMSVPVAEEGSAGLHPSMRCAGGSWTVGSARRRNPEANTPELMTIAPKEMSGGLRCMATADPASRSWPNGRPRPSRDTRSLTAPVMRRVDQSVGLARTPCATWPDISARDASGFGIESPHRKCKPRHAIRAAARSSSLSTGGNAGDGAQLRGELPGREPDAESPLPREVWAFMHPPG